MKKKKKDSIQTPNDFAPSSSCPVSCPTSNPDELTNDIFTAIEDSDIRHGK